MAFESMGVMERCTLYNSRPENFGKCPDSHPVYRKELNNCYTPCKPIFREIKA